MICRSETLVHRLVMPSERSGAMKPELRVILDELKRRPKPTLPLSTIVAFARIADQDPRIAELVRIQSEATPLTDDESEDNQYALTKFAMDYLSKIGASISPKLSLSQGYYLVNAKRKGIISEIDESSAESVLKDSMCVDWGDSK